MAASELEAKFQKLESLLDQLEPQLKTFVTIHGVEPRLLDEIDIWDGLARQPKLHRGGLESYQFERYRSKYCPSRAIRWMEGKSYCLVQVYADESLEKFTMWSVIGRAPFGQFDFQDTQVIQLPEDLTHMPQLLEESYRKLQEAII